MSSSYQLNTVAFMSFFLLSVLQLSLLPSLKRNYDTSLYCFYFNDTTWSLN